MAKKSQSHNGGLITVKCNCREAGCPHTGIPEKSLKQLSAEIEARIKKDLEAARYGDKITVVVTATLETVWISGKLEL